MSKSIILNGNWIGFYEYGNGYPESFKGRRILFEAAIGQGPTDFLGKIKEKNEIGETDDVRVKGTIIDDRIIFTKHHTKVYSIDENGKINPIVQGKDVILYYRGVFYSEEDRFKGEWEDQELGGTNNPGGIWEMWRKP